MTIVEIRKIEEEREGSLGVIHLQKEGSFYHANDWSAWLMTKYPIGEAANKPMTVTAKKLKDEEHKQLPWYFSAHGVVQCKESVACQQAVAADRCVRRWADQVR